MLLKEILEEAWEQRLQEYRSCVRRGYNQGENNGKVMEGDRAAELEMGNTQISRGPCGDMTRERYVWKETGETHVGG